MSNRYDNQTTIFSPEGRLHQVEYAMNASSQAGAVVGIISSDGVVLAAEKRITGKLLEMHKSTEKTYIVDDHITVSVAGITADANILLNYARLQAQRYKCTYGVPIPVEQLLQTVCDLKHSYTQYGGQRPFGVSLLFAGWDDDHKFQLYHSDPSGNYSGWQAKAIGANNQAGQSMLTTTYHDQDDMKKVLTLKEALILAVKALDKIMDKPSPIFETMEFTTLTRDAKTGIMKYHVFNKTELKELLKDAVAVKKRGLTADEKNSNNTSDI